MKIRKSKERGHANHGWLDTYHTFSFGDYYDPEWMGFGSLRVINDDIVLPGEGFGMHPHRDMEIITYVISGQLEHKDSMGNGRIIKAGDIQYMSAGRGIRHSEFNPSSYESVRLLQIWIQPDAKDVDPSYAEIERRDVEKGAWKLVTSKKGRDGSIGINQNAELSIAHLDKSQMINFDLKRNRKAWLQVAEGELVVNGNTLNAGDAAYFTEPGNIDIEADSEATVLLFDLAN
ncbi:pirin family protein [Puniceicoccaceae bacterium K14]|nr:pirin family protein [Puniceicoccaceae bacterium K14]